MSNIQNLYVNNDTILEVAALRNELTGEYLNDATVAVTLLTADGEEVTGDTWPKPMVYVEESDGLYRTTLVQTLDLVSGGRYKAEITATGGVGLTAAWTVDCVARLRA